MPPQQHNPDDKEKDEVTKFGYKEFKDMYEESLQYVKDEESFFVHGKIIRYAK